MQRGIHLRSMTWLFSSPPDITVFTDSSNSQQSWRYGGSSSGLHTSGFFVALSCCHYYCCYYVIKWSGKVNKARKLTGFDRGTTVLVEKCAVQFPVSAITMVASAGLEDLILPDNWRFQNYFRPGWNQEFLSSHFTFLSKVCSMISQTFSHILIAFILYIHT